VRRIVPSTGEAPAAPLASLRTVVTSGVLSMRLVFAVLFVSTVSLACKQEAPPPPPAPVVLAPPPEAPPPSIDPATVAAMAKWMEVEPKAEVAFEVLATVLEKLEAAPTPNDPKLAGQHATAKFKALARILDVIVTTGEGTIPEHVAFVQKRGELLALNPSDGKYFLRVEPIWKAATTYAETPSAEQLAWLAVDKTLAGECEGKVACLLERSVATGGEYVKRFPKGAHVSESLASIRSSLPEEGDESLAGFNRADIHKSRTAIASMMEVVAKCEHADVAETLTALRAADGRIATVKQ